MSDDEPPILDYARPSAGVPPRRPRRLLKRLWRIDALRLWIAAVIVVTPLAMLFEAFGFVYGHAGIIASLVLVGIGGQFLRSHPWHVYVVAAIFGCIVSIGLYSAARKTIVVQNDTEYPIYEMMFNFSEHSSGSVHRLPARRTIEFVFRDLGYDGKMSAGVHFTGEEITPLHAIRRASVTGYRGRTRIVVESAQVVTITDE